MNGVTARPKCPSCGMPVGDGSRLCGYCGARITHDAQCMPSVPFKMSYSAPEQLRVNKAHAFFFYFSTVRDDVEMVRVALKKGCETLAESVVDLCSGECNIELTPQKPGDVWLDVELSLKYFQTPDDEVWKSRLHVPVKDSSEVPKSVVINTNINVDNRGVMRSEDGGIGTAPSLSPMAGLDDESKYRCDTSRKTPIDFSLCRSPERIALVSGADSVLLTSGNDAFFGRGWASIRCDCIIAVCGENGEEDERLTGHVSKVHFRLERRDGAIWAFDGQPGEPSTNGTNLDGRPLPNDGARLCAGRHVLSVMRSRTGGILVDFDVDVQSSEQNCRAPSVRIALGDGERAALLMIPPHGSASISDGLRLGHDGNRFIVRRERTPKPEPLSIGRAIRARGTEWLVEPPGRLGRQMAVVSK